MVKFSNQTLIEWGKTTTPSSTITLPLAYTNYYIVVACAHGNFPGGREPHALNRTLNNWNCTLGSAGGNIDNYWDSDTHWLTVGN